MTERQSTGWVQLSLFEEPEGKPERSDAEVVASPPPPPSDPASRRAAYRASHVRVTSDEDVAASSEHSNRISAEITWQLAQSLTDEQLAELRARLHPPAA